MTLDITRIAGQIGDMVIKMKSGSREQQEHLKCAFEKLCDSNLNPESLKFRIAHARTPWPIAGIFEDLNQHYPVPSIPSEYTAVATDGSNIDVDRHKSAHCYLINVGAVSLHYGPNPAAELESEPHLYFDKTDLILKDDKNKRREQQIAGELLDARRAVEECRKLAATVAGLTDTGPVLALMDGSLVLFSLESFPNFVLENLLDNGFIQALDALKKIGNTRQLTLASYISLPRSADVVNALKVAICPQETVDCDRCSQIDSPACDILSGVNDRMLFDRMLGIGERSSVFINPSAILKRYGQHHVYFFYLRAEDEIARIEVPEWVAVRRDLLDLTQALVLDQCRRGQGYPVALSEAHEQAVVTGSDREEFWGLVEEALEDGKMPTYTSIKSRSKRTRWI